MRLTDEIIEKYGLVLDRRQTGQLSRFSGIPYQNSHRTPSSMAGRTPATKRESRSLGRFDNPDKLAKKTVKEGPVKVLMTLYEEKKSLLDSKKAILNKKRKDYLEEGEIVARLKKEVANLRTKLLAEGVSRSLLT